MAKQRIMVDMSATLLHHGHIRLLQKASLLGDVIVGLTSDDEIMRYKHYEPEMPFEARREILLAIRYVSEVVETPWLITQTLLDQYRIDRLVHGEDNQNDVDPERLVLFPRTQGVSSTELRQRSVRSLAAIEGAKAE